MPTIEQKRSFLSLACQLSPENLSCDGELSMRKVAQRRADLNRQWKALEKEVGHRVDEEAAYRWVDEVRAFEQAERAKQIAAAPQVPGLTCHNPQVWSKPGRTGSSAYYIQCRDGKTYKLYSEFAQVLLGKEQIGVYDSLAAAAVAGDAFLTQVTFESF